MQIPQEKINQLKSLYRDVFGSDLSDNEAQEQGLAILRFVSAKMEFAFTAKEEEG
jgi:hypothetical protein